MQTFSYFFTDLTDFKSMPIEMKLGTHEEALNCATFIAREMLERMPSLGSKGLCVTVCDQKGETISIVPLDPIS
jgi:hypothetical protein